MAHDDAATTRGKYQESNRGGAIKTPRDAEGETSGTSEESGRGPVGQVYFIETIDSQFVKIGYSAKPLTRLSQLGTIMPVRLIGTFPAMRPTESWLHRKFAAFHETGEWFRSTPEIRLFIETLGLDPPPRPAALPAPPAKKARPARNSSGGITLAEHLARIQSAGGKARAEALTEAQRKRIARSGGKVGGKARAEALTPERRREIAAAAVRARWANVRKAEKAAAKQAKQRTDGGD